MRSRTTSLGLARRVSRIRSRRWLHAAAALGVCLALTLAFESVALGDAADVKIPPSQHPTLDAKTSFDPSTGHVTVTVTGGWSWPTHGKDCNTDRAGTGVAIDWFDPKQPGNPLGNNAGSAATVPIAGVPTPIFVGTAAANSLNAADNVVHPTENDTGGGAVVDISSPAGWQDWRGGCGVFSADQVLGDGVASTAHGNLGRIRPGLSFFAGYDNPTPPAVLTGRAGAELKHVYASVADVSKVCAVTYDVHGTDPSGNNGVGIPSAQKEVTAGFATRNGDNGVEKNDGTPAGNACPAIIFTKPTLTTDAGGPVTIGADGTVDLTDVATLSGGTADAQGTIAFKLFSDDNCSNQVGQTSTVPVNGADGRTYVSDPITVSADGTYHWTAAYSGDPDNLAAGSVCGAANENPVVNPLAKPNLSSTASGTVNRRAIRRHARHRLRRYRTLGDSIQDTATLSGGRSPTGSIAFRLYGPDDSTCARPVVFTATSVVSGNGDYVSAPFTPSQAGTYRWVDTYSGDPQNAAAGPTACSDDKETVVVERMEPSLTSTASGLATRVRTRSGRRRLRITRNLGTPIHDTAHLSGSGASTGTISFDLYAPGDTDCSGTRVFTSIVPVAGDGDYNSASFSPTTSGTYRWRATYSGDSNTTPAGPTACGDPAETVIVARDQPALTSTASGTVAVGGGALSDTAHLSGGTAPTGTITFRLYGPNDDGCARTPAFSSSATVTGNGDYSSGPFTPSQPGAYHWRATYSGDSDNEAAGPTACADPAETVIVTPFVPVQPALSSTAQTPATADQPLTDTAHLSGGQTPTGTISFALYGPDDTSCSGGAVFTSTSAVSGNGDYTSAPFAPTQAGSYRWRASYSGDAQNAGAGPTACGEPDETFVADKAQPGFTTIATESAGYGRPVTDTAHLNGGVSPTGTIRFHLYGPNDDSCSGTPAFSTQAQVAGNGDYTSSAFTPLHAGTYHWVASYSGDANNNAVATGCGDNEENTSIAPAEPTMFSLATGSLLRRLAVARDARATGGRLSPRHRRAAPSFRAAGLPIQDAVRLSGAAAPGGFISYSLYGPDNASCLGAPAFVTETAVSGNGDYLSEPFVPTAAGTYRWVASYSGDADNAPAGPTACGEPAETVVVVQPAQPTFSTSASGAVTQGGAVHDTAHLIGGVAPGGSITFDLYGPGGSCSGKPVFTSAVPVAGNGDYDSASFTPTASGTYRWVARYSGDSGNDPAGPSACGETGETVDVRNPDVTPAQPGFSTGRPNDVAGLGTPINDVAHLTGGSTPTGAISFALFGPDDDTCAKPPVFTSETAVVGAGDYASASYVVSRPGTYRWVASYSGDIANAPAGPTACGEPAETVTVLPDPSPNPSPPFDGGPVERFVLGPPSAEQPGPKPPPGHKPRHRQPTPHFTG